MNAMLTLCADTSGATLSFTLMENASEILSKSWTESAKGRMNELFFSCLQGFLAEAGARPMDIDRWVSIVGPGSFTGIRIGVAAVSGIAIGLQKEHVGLSALDAAALLSSEDEIAVAAAIRMNEYALRRYNFKTDLHSDIELQLLEPPQAGIIFVNGKKNSIGYDCLTRAILDPRVDAFFGDAAPVYVKRSEAEINFDKAR
ncbi:MAG: tRNA (adenosine(37)-N6)-threonylcarbamoyltransferase complex dimerization subunit type 1 TsaB [Deferribacteraceae bacterium]|jgi:tRNA threonylcarbamoyl adenosine modification protein YeaZ|nr:tRNA (adenosine(37)-N6)-threonylcarbamoyltransferase complex dimerization subunit type 1 TsaB [Deferribacteraceae bacterium]